MMMNVWDTGIASGIVEVLVALAFMNRLYSFKEDISSDKKC